jgi:spore germination protein
MLSSPSKSRVLSPPLELTGWLVHWDDGESLRAFERHAPQISRVAPGWYDCGPDGLPRRLSDAAVRPGHKELVQQIARTHGVRIFALTANFNAALGDFDAAIVSRFLNDPALMRRHARMLAVLAKEDGADGIDLDYESLKAADRDAFSFFVETLATELHALKLELAIAVQPKTSEPGHWEGAMAQDWRRLGKAVDYFRAMAYDHHWPGSEAGPIAPPAWAREVLGLALALVPKEKIELGVPAYGYDWKGKKARSYDWDGFQKLQLKKGVARRHGASGELTLKYGEREAWFADSQAMAPKFELAKEAGILGLALWRLGSEDPAFWERLKQSR